nr:TraB/GumN family protein [Sphingomicrobium astaxanthinifaciens]
MIARKIDPAGPCFSGTEPPPRPALWAVEDADTTIYLFGTVHLLASTTCWQDARVTRAIAAADELVTEVRTDPGPLAIVGLLAEVAFDPANPPLRARLDPAHHATLDRLLARQPMPLPESFYDKIDTWALAEFLLDGLLVGAEAGADSGVEHELALQFEAAGKPHSALETLAFQIQMSDAYSLELQAAWLDSWFAARREGHAAGAFAGAGWDAMLEQWRTGVPLDIAAHLAATGGAFDRRDAARDARLTEEYLEHLLYARNRRWVDWIETRLAAPGTLFVAVGAGHLAGARSVIDEVRARGLPLRPID